MNIYCNLFKLIISSAFTLFLFSCSNTKYFEDKENLEVIVNPNYVMKQDIFRKEVETENNEVKIVKSYNNEGVMLSLEKFQLRDTSLLIGEQSFWYPSGKLWKVLNFNNQGMYDGKLMIYYESGVLKREDLYSSGALSSGRCYDSIGNVINYFPYDLPPKIDLEELAKCINYPSYLISKGLEKNFIIRILSDSKGKIRRIKFFDINSMNYLKESIKCIIRNTKIEPAVIDGISSESWISVPTNLG